MLNQIYVHVCVYIYIVTAAKEKKAANKAVVDRQKAEKKEEELSSEWKTGAKQSGRKEEMEAKKVCTKRMIIS